MAIRRALSCLLLAIAALTGCRTAHQVWDPEYADVIHDVDSAWYSPDPVVEAIGPASSNLAGPHPVEDYIQFALEQNPAIHAARKRMESLALQVPVAASLQDPMLGMTFFPEQVQTAAGQQEFALNASQKLPWHGKLGTRAEMAQSQTNVARAQLATVELAMIEKVKQAYYELYFIEQALAVTEADQTLLGEIRDVANTRYKAGLASQQDLLRAELEISNVENELIRLRQRLESGQARLARLLHISPQTKVRAVDHLKPEQVPRDLDWLQRQAVAARPE